MATSGDVLRDIGEWESVIGFGAFDLFRRSEVLCDVVVIVAAQRFPCSRIVLAAHSLFFRAMFTGPMSERQQNEETVAAAIGADTFERILLYMGNSEQFQISAANVSGLFSAANYLQVSSLLNTNGLITAESKRKQKNEFLKVSCYPWIRLGQNYLAKRRRFCTGSGYLLECLVCFVYMLTCTDEKFLGWLGGGELFSIKN